MACLSSDDIVISGDVAYVSIHQNEARRSETCVSSVDICIGVDVAWWREKYPMSLFGPAIVHPRAVRTARGTF